MFQCCISIQLILNMKDFGFLLVVLVQIHKPAAQQLNIIITSTEIDCNPKHVNASVKMRPREFPGDNIVDIDVNLFKEIRNSLMVKIIQKMKTIHYSSQTYITITSIHYFMIIHTQN